MQKRKRKRSEKDARSQIGGIRRRDHGEAIERERDLDPMTPHPEQYSKGAQTSKKNREGNEEQLYITKEPESTKNNVKVTTA